jgi:HPt (histidine-containing phosphotransfer) domain-containing protein
MAHLAHTTISTAGTIGAAALADIAGLLQEALRTDERAKVAALVVDFAHAHERVVGELRAFVEKG